MPNVEKYGAQPAIELLRQLIDHSFFYDLKEKSKIQIVDFTIFCAMLPSNSGRNKLSERFLRHFNIIGLNEPDDKTLETIFSTILDWNFKNRLVVKNKQLSVTASAFVFYKQLMVNGRPAVIL
jgi:dynein heavy chain